MVTLCQLPSIHHPASYGFASGLTAQSARLVSGLYTVLVRFFTFTETFEVTWFWIFIVKWGSLFADQLWVFLHTGRGRANSQVGHNLIYLIFQILLL